MDDEDSLSPTTLRPDRTQRLERVLAWMETHRLLMALLSFGVGAASFVFVARAVRLAQWLALLLVVAWLVLLIEGTLGRKLAHRRWWKLSPFVLRYATQSLHQETYFFCLPFLLATTIWSSGQALFTGLGIVAALCSMWDPIYYGWIGARPWAMLAYHAASMYLAALVVPPLLWQLDTTRSLALASLIIGTLAVPSLLHLLKPRRAVQWTLLLAIAAGLAGASWLGRRWVPPATLRTQRALITLSVDPDAREPDTAVQTVTPDQLRQSGVCAFMSISAPRGLEEPIFHRWLFNGALQTTVPLAIAGGREQGYRVWSCKHGFPPDPRGRWRVEAVTDSGQLIGDVRFKVADPVTPAAGS